MSSKDFCVELFLLLEEMYEEDKQELNKYEEPIIPPKITEKKPFILGNISESRFLNNKKMRKQTNK